MKHEMYALRYKPCKNARKNIYYPSNILHKFLSSKTAVLINCINPVKIQWFHNSYSFFSSLKDALFCNKFSLQQNLITLGHFVQGVLMHCDDTVKSEYKAVVLETEHMQLGHFPNILILLTRTWSTKH